MLNLNLEEVKNYLRVSFDDDDNYIKSLIVVAEDYIRDGVTDFEIKVFNDRFKLKAKIVALVLIQNLYDERYLVGSSLNVNYIIKSMINQMEYGDYSETQPRELQETT